MEQGVQHGHRGRESGATVDPYITHKGYYSKRWPRRAQWPYGRRFCFLRIVVAVAWRAAKYRTERKSSSKPRDDVFYEPLFRFGPLQSFESDASQRDGKVAKPSDCPRGRAES